MELFNLATFIALLVVALQYIINIFLADVLEGYWLNHGNDDDTARTKRNGFVKICSWGILILFIMAIVLGTIGLLRE